MTFCLYFMFSLVSMATFETNRYNLKWSNRSYWDPIILVPRFRNMVTVMEFKVKQARKQINFVRELKLDIFIHMVHLRMEVSAVYRRYLHVATGGNWKESTQLPSFLSNLTCTIHAGKLVVRLHKVKKVVEFENFMEISCPLSVKYCDWMEDCLWFEHGMKHLNEHSIF